MSEPPPPAVANLIRALARQTVREHLTRRDAEKPANDAERTNHVPLPASDKAA